MAQFRGTLQGSRGAASRLGSKASGLRVTADGWRSGVTVVGYVDEDTGRDAFNVHATTGSGHGGDSPGWIVTVTTDDDGRVIVEPAR